MWGYLFFVWKFSNNPLKASLLVLADNLMLDNNSLKLSKNESTMYIKYRLCDMKELYILLY